MITIRLYQIDAFADEIFRGNPAAVCPLQRWLPASTMQAIAAENNLSETAFLVPENGDYALRWFTPTTEVDLCGHATLASAFVVFQRLEPDRRSVRFHTRSGALEVTRDGDRLSLDLPAWPPFPCPVPVGLESALGVAPMAMLANRRDYLVVFEEAAQIRVTRPNLTALGGLDRHAVIVTAAGDDCDFVSRFFAPAMGVGEDPVTGSAHCTLVPYWASRLGKTSLHARQVSARGGELFCEMRGDRVRIAGHAALYLEGTLRL